MRKGSGGTSELAGLPVAAQAARIAEGRRSNLSRLILSTCCCVVTAAGTGTVAEVAGVGVTVPGGRGRAAGAEFALTLPFKAAGSARGRIFKGTALFVVDFAAAFCWAWQSERLSRPKASKPKNRNGVALIITVRTLRL